MGSGGEGGRDGVGERGELVEREREKVMDFFGVGVGVGSRCCGSVLPFFSFPSEFTSQARKLW